MASKMAMISFLLVLNLLFITMASAYYVPCPPPPVKPPCGKCHQPPPVKPPPVKPPPVNPPTSCPRDTLKLGVCTDVLNLLILKLGTPPKYPCCSLLEGLADAEAAVCLCTALKANILGINLNLAVDLTLLLNFCGKGVPYGFQCA